jgi:penicillin-binding protein 2
MRYASIDTTPERAADLDHTAGSRFLGRAADPRRVTLAFVVLLFASAALLLRAFTVQVIGGSEFKEIALRNREHVELFVPERGIMYDRTGAPLVQNFALYAIGIVPAQFPQDASRGDALERLSRVVGVDPGEIDDTLRAYPAQLTVPILVGNERSYDEALAALVMLSEFRAVRLVATADRQYGSEEFPSESISHVLGFTGRIDPQGYRDLSASRYRPGDEVGKSGAELQYETELRGRAGASTSTVDARGRVVATVADDAPVASSDLHLSIDLKLQSLAESSLRQHAASANARRGAVVAMDPASGAIRALVSLPSFSSTALARGLSKDEFVELVNDPDRPMFPRAISGTYPAGSLVKPFVAAAALEKGTILPSTRILSTGGIQIGSFRYPDWKEGGHGLVGARQAIAESVNTFFYVIAGGWPGGATGAGRLPGKILGPDGIASALRAFGFGDVSGIDLAGEAKGLVPTPEWKREVLNSAWYVGDTYHLAIGQGNLLVTPLQVAVATASLANGGYRVRPYVVQNADDDPADRVPISLANGEVLAVLREGMRLAVTSGSAAALRDVPVRVFGKTGTAETAPSKPPHSWFSGFAEYEDDGLVVVVLVEEAGEGSRVAVPVARDIFASWAIRHTRKEW